MSKRSDRLIDERDSLRGLLETVATKAVDAEALLAEAEARERREAERRAERFGASR